MNLLARLLRWISARGGRRSFEVVVYTRADCPLCDEALHWLRKHQRSERLAIREVDIDGDPELMSKYGDKVPAIEIDGKLRFFGKLNEVLLRRLLRAKGSE